MSVRLEPGTPAPAFTLADASGKEHSLSDYAGSKVILYFYPKASTPGCTKEACDFRDNLASLKSLGYVVLGVSPDSPAAIARFVEKESLTFPLLSDADHAVAEAYGAWGEKKNYGRVYEGLIRSTFVIDEQGVVALAQYNVRATGHVAKLRRDLGIDPKSGMFSRVCASPFCCFLRGCCSTCLRSFYPMGLLLRLGEPWFLVYTNFLLPQTHASSDVG